MSKIQSNSVEPAQIRERSASDPRLRLIDVRTPGEFASAHIPGSHNVPLDLLQQHRHELAVRHDDQVVLVCGSGTRADQARALLVSVGSDRISVLRGGITAWENEGGELDRGKGTWAMERQVRLVAGLVVLIGVLGSTVVRPLKWLAGFIGAGLTFAAVTNTCAMAKALSLLPYNRTPAPDRHTLLHALTNAEIQG
jgi:rhodanese-related sulfurtransferase